MHLTSYTKFLLSPLCSISSQIFTSNLEACNRAGLPYIIGQLPSFGTEASALDQLMRLPVWVLGRLPQWHGSASPWSYAKYSALRSQGLPLAQQTVELNHPLWTYQQFDFHLHQNFQGHRWISQSGGWKCNCCTSGDILTAWRAFKVAWLSEQILKYFSDLITFWTS